MFESGRGVWLQFQAVKVNLNVNVECWVIVVQKCNSWNANQKQKSTKYEHPVGYEYTMDCIHSLLSNIKNMDIE